MLIVVPILMILLLALATSIRGKESPMDRDVVLRVRRFADDVRREQLLPYD
jgi:hypothetical protein